MAVGIPAKRRKLSEEETESSTTQNAISSLGRKVRVYRTSLAAGRAGEPGPPAGPAWTTIRVVFPDHYVLEAQFGRWETLQKLIDLVGNAILPPKRDFYIYTAPPKERIPDLEVDFLAAGLIPGAVVYFGCDDSSPGYLRQEICSMEGLDYDSDFP